MTLYSFKFIPFSSLGNENGMLVGFKPDYIKIYGEEENVRTDVIIGIYDGKLTKTNKYTSLVGLNILKMAQPIYKISLKNIRLQLCMNFEEEFYKIAKKVFL